MASNNPFKKTKTQKAKLGVTAHYPALEKITDALLNEDIKAFQELINVDTPQVGYLVVTPIVLSTELNVRESFIKKIKNLCGDDFLFNYYKSYMGLLQLTILSGRLPFVQYIIKLLKDLVVKGKLSSATSQAILNGIGLLRYKSVNAYKNYSQPLFVAFMRDQNIAKLLIEAGATINPKPVDQSIVQLLLENGGMPKMDELPSGFEARFILYQLMCAHRLFNQDKLKDAIQFLIEHGVDVNYKLGNSNILYCAVEQRGYAIVELLLNTGADPDFQDNDGCTILMVASKRESQALTTLPTGESIFSTTDGGRVINNHVLSEDEVKEKHAIMTLLIEKGARTNLRGNNGHTIVHLEASKGCFQLLELCTKDLKQNKKQLNNSNSGIPPDRNTPLIDFQDADGHTALFHALPHPKVVQELVRLGADLDVQNKRGNTALEMSLVNQQFESMRIMVEEGQYDLEKTDALYDVAPIFFAVESGSLESVRYLCGRNVNLKVVNGQGLSPWIYAIKLKHYDVAKYLLEEQWERLNFTDPVPFVISASKETTNDNLDLDKEIKQFFDFSHRKFKDFLIKTRKKLDQNSANITRELVSPFVWICLMTGKTIEPKYLELLWVAYKKVLGESFSTFIESENFLVYCVETLAMLGNLEALKVLLKANPKFVQATFHLGKTLLHAVDCSLPSEKITPLVKFLVDFYQVHYGKDELIKWVGYLCNVLNEDALLKFTSCGHMEIVQYLIENGARINFNLFNNPALRDALWAKQAFFVLAEQQLLIWLGKSQIRYQEACYQLMHFIFSEDKHFVVESESTEFILGVEFDSEMIRVRISEGNILQIATAIQEVLSNKPDEKLLRQKIKEILVGTCLPREEKERREKKENLQRSILTFMMRFSAEFDKLNLKIEKNLKDSLEIHKLSEQVLANLDQHHCFENDAKTYEEHKEKHEKIMADLKEMIENQQTVLDNFCKNYPLARHSELSIEVNNLIKENRFDEAQKKIEDKQQELEKYFGQEKINEILRFQSKLKGMVDELQHLANAEEAAIKKATLASKKLNQKPAHSRSKDKKGKNKKRGGEVVSSPEPKKPDAGQAAKSTNFKGQDSVTSPAFSRLRELASAGKEYTTQLLKDAKKIKENSAREFGEQFKSCIQVGGLQDSSDVRLRGHKPVPMTLDVIGQVAAKTDKSDVISELRQNLELKFQGEQQKFLEYQLLRWNLIILFETLQRIHGDVFDPRTSKAIRDNMVYQWNSIAKNSQGSPLRTSDLRLIIERLLSFLSQSQIEKNSEEVVFHSIDSSGFLQGASKQKTLDSTAGFCEQQVKEGLMLWRLCQEIVQSQDGYDKRMIINGLGMVFGLIGNALSHFNQLYNKNVTDEKMKNGIARIRASALGQVRETTGCTMEECIKIGNQFRHLDRVPRENKENQDRISESVEYVTAEISWKVLVQGILERSQFIPKSQKPSGAGPDPTTSPSKASGATSSPSPAGELGDSKRGKAPTPQFDQHKKSSTSPFSSTLGSTSQSPAKVKFEGAKS